MDNKRKYPICEKVFKELIEPIIKKERKKSGRPTTGSHYTFFALFYTP